MDMLWVTVVTVEEMEAVVKASSTINNHMKIRDIIESATAGATSAAMVGSGGVVAGFKADRSYTGSPGKSGTKSPKQVKPKMQKPGTNALDMNVGLMAGQGAIKR
jgi:hypothetical protein